MTIIAPKADPQPRREFLRLELLSLGSAAGILLIGFLPTRSLGGGPAVLGMLVGVGIALVGTLAGLVPPLLSLNQPAQQRQQALLLGMGARFLITLVMLLAIVLGTPVDRLSVAIWTALAYLVLLAVDVAALANLLNRAPRSAS